MQVWRDNPYGTENTVAVHIRHLREKVEYNPAEPCYLKVISGGGAIKWRNSVRNRKDSVGAKAAAWVGITLGAVVFFAGSAGVLLMDQAGVYEMSREQFLTKSYQSVADQYAIRALDYSVNMENGAKPENNRWNDTYFRYGIIGSGKY